MILNLDSQLYEKDQFNKQFNVIMKEIRKLNCDVHPSKPLSLISSDLEIQNKPKFIC